MNWPAKEVLKFTSFVTFCLEGRIKPWHWVFSWLVSQGLLPQTEYALQAISLWEVFQEAVCRSISFSSICLWGKTRWHSRSERLNSTKLLSCGYQHCTKWQKLVMETMQCINLFKHDYYRFVCKTFYSLQKGKWFHSHILQNLRWHNWHITLLLNSLWAVLQSGAMAGNFPVNYTYEAALMLFAGWFHYHWCLASKVDECFLWCRVSEIYMGRHNLQ